MFTNRVSKCYNNILIRKQFQFYKFAGFCSFSGGPATDYNKKNNKRIADFYAGRSVLLTGGTGFVGKAITEKLLYSCENLDKIYLLIRQKDGVTAEERLNKIFESVLYDRIRQHNPDVLKKIVPIAGDVVLPNLGITPKDELEIINNVSVVLHMAATINFSSRLSTTMKVNFEGTRRLLELSHRIKNIESFVYSSTAYLQINAQVLSEFVYPTPATPEEVYQFIEKYGHDRKRTKKFLDGSPNSYIFTKLVTESYVSDNHGDVPTVIVRPSSVTAAIKEPAPGWMDAWQGASVLMDTSATGFNRVVYGSKSNYLDCIPVDYVANATIIAAANASREELKVFNLTTSFENPMTLGELAEIFVKETIENKKHDLPYPFVIFTKSMTVIYLVTVLQAVPAVVADLWLLLTGRKAKYMKTLSIAVLVRHFFSPFSNKSWSMKADNIRTLLQSLSPADRKTFPCDPAHIHWATYLKDFRHGCFKYLPKLLNNKF